ncbi:MAG: response regulator [Deltaproteobacteria bacterium]|nr:response regulator [Deltaproteobacteria bacterium]MBW2070546.1 response regulator [Deltaproteobacteria bacterium]
MAKILVLDDVADAVNAITRILTKKGHAVAGFTEEDDAFTYAQEHKVDLAILDVKLKKMSGVQALQKLKKMQPDIKAIMLTGYPGLDTAAQSFESGAHEYCVKPIDRDELEMKVSVVLAGLKNREDVGD